MIELHDLSSDESSDDVIASNVSRSSLNVCASPDQCSSNNIKYNSSNIKMLLKEQPEKYILVENQKVNHAKPSLCWSRFALPAVKDENDGTIIIKNFATCRSCYTTYTHTYGSTKSLNAHKCSKEQSLTPVSSPLILKTASLNSKINRFPIERKRTLTSLISLWICTSMRPISVVEDEGFLNVIEQCLNWNSGPFGNINGKSIVPSRSTITREIDRQANDIRQRLGIVLRDAAKQGFLSISPDLWSDKFKQNSYLGLTAHYTDDHYVLHSIDLCCEPYNEINKRADNIRKAITVALARFGIDDLMDKIIFVSDRGSNILKALEDYQVINCFPHRLNNVLKRTFYSAGTEEKKKKRKKKELKKNQGADTFSWNDHLNDDDDPLLDYDDRDTSESEDDDMILDGKLVELALRSLSSSTERDHVNIIEKDLPPHATQLLATIVRCKQLCCYVKRVNWNPMLQALGKLTIKQEIIVRWLSMSQLLESILSSYSALTNIATEKGTLHTLPSIDVSTVAAVVGLFAPWKHVMERVQATNTPSLHLVVTSYWYLLESLIVTKDEASDKAAKGLVFFKIRARQLLKIMFSLHDLHWIAATLNPRTRMLKVATDSERALAYNLVCSELVKIVELQSSDDNRSIQSTAATSASPPPHKKFKSYTTKFNDDLDCGELSNHITDSARARREFDMYLQMNLTKCAASNDDNDNPLYFWKEQEYLLPNMAKLAKKIFCIPASSAAVERAFSSAGVILSQRRTSINPSTVNNIILVRSATAHLKNHI